jgi:hypothetical protein
MFKKQARDGAGWWQKRGRESNIFVQVIINIWEPAWLIGGICDMRRVFGKDECEFMMQDPWISEPWNQVFFFVNFFILF